MYVVVGCVVRICSVRVVVVTYESFIYIGIFCVVVVQGTGVIIIVVICICGIRVVSAG